MLSILPKAAQLDRAGIAPRREVRLLLPLQRCVVKARYLEVFGEDCLDSHLPKLNIIGSDKKAQHLALILQKKLPERRTEARYCGSAAKVREGSAKAPCPTSPHSIRRSCPPEVTGDWGQPIAEELLIAECQWSREADLNGSLQGRLVHTGPRAPDTPPGLFPRSCPDAG